MKRMLALASVVVLSLAAWQNARTRRASAVPPPAPALFQIPGGGQINATAVGHEFRQDDLPALAAAPDGSLWVAWLSFVGDRDDVVIRHYTQGKWGTLHWVPNTSGDSWLPQVAVDRENRVWVVWSQQVDGNWDIYARRLDPAKQEWSGLERLSSDPLPDVNPRLASDGKGNFAVVWQGFRGKNSNIFLKSFDGERWSAEVRVTDRATNDWEPAVGIDSRGTAWVAYDTYKAGNYDIFLSQVAGGKLRGPEIEVASSARFEARPTVAIDSADRVWVAYEAGSPNWGKDNGYMIRASAPGVPLGGQREARIRCYENGAWREPATSLSSVLKGQVYQPHVAGDGKGSVWVGVKVRKAGGEQQAGAANPRGYFEYWMTHLGAGGWSEAFALPNSKGRSSTRMSAAVDSAGNFWAAWPTDNRRPGFYHRPIRQEVFAGMINLPAAGAPTLQAAQTQMVEAKPGGHADEAGDLQAIRSYTASVDGRNLNIVRGDFHRHTELSWDGGGTADGNLQDFYRYMIDAASMDFGASTDHQGGAWPYWWWYTQKMTDMYHVPGAYVPIFGYERSAVYPNGHRNVFFARRSESRVTPFVLRDGAEGFGVPAAPIGDEPGVGSGDLVENDTKLLYEDIGPRNGIAIPHTSATRMGTDWRDNHPTLEPVVEIYQGARSNYEQLDAPFATKSPQNDDLNQRAGYQPAGMVSNAWAKGYKLGIITSSDHGSTHISYAMVYTRDRTRQGILDAIRKRHTYGAMDNIILDVHMGEHFMGDEFRLTKAEPLRIKVRGTRSIAKLSVIKDSQIVYSTEPNKQNVELEYTDSGSIEGRHYYYVRVQQDNQMLAWSSPMFVNYK